MGENMRRNIDCDQRCVIPEGKVMSDVPPSRHDWADVLRCPNEGCDRTFLVADDPQAPGPRGSGRFRCVVDAGSALWRYWADEPPTVGAIVTSRHGFRAMVTKVEVDEAADVARVSALALP